MPDDSPPDPPDPQHMLFYRSGPQPCPYLPGRLEQKIFTLIDSDAPDLTLTLAGFRRSHDVLYRPACPDCNLCTPVRIPVREYRWSCGERRIFRCNEDLTCTQHPSVATAEQYHLFNAYQQVRHPGGDMAAMSASDYAGMIEDGLATTSIAEWRLPGGQLIAAMMIDAVPGGYSAVYSFFDPDRPRRSLGTFMILSLVKALQGKGLGHLYLGYYIPGSRKMDYKARFHPLEALGPRGWQTVTRQIS